jgi:hypothetical protein
VKHQDPDPDSGMNNPDHISESLKTFFGVKKILMIFDVDSGWKKVGSGINITDPQHCTQVIIVCDHRGLQTL